MAKAKGYEVVSLGIDYDQTHRIELLYAAEQCKAFKVERRVIRVGWDKPVRHIPTGRTVKSMSKTISPAFLPGRNGLFLMLAAAEAAGIGASEVWTGVNSVDFSGYPDCTPEFIQSFRAMLAFAIPKGPKLVAPLQLKSKPQIANMARRLGVEESTTWSCYRPAISPTGVVPCTQCDACKLHSYAWRGKE
jgi:7-cyano-7-deazaguanine synthase